MPKHLTRGPVWLAAAFLLVAAAGCAANAHRHGAEVARAHAEFGGPGGLKGKATLIEYRNDTGSIVRVIVDVQGDPAVLKPGLHGIHIHEKGECEPSFAAAGGHFDPGPYGQPDVAKNHPYHMGDLPNLEVDAQGHGKLDAMITSVTLTDGPLTVFDVDGSALIIHQDPDLRTGQAAGGARIGCAVIRR